MKSTKLLLFILPAIFVVFLVIHSCKKPAAAPHNPFSDIIRDDSSSHGIPVDPLTITYVHKKVLSTRCALNGCHDGHFQPDFRTPQSSYSTLVYAPIIKNDTAHHFAYRVIPFDTGHSVLYQRITNCCFVNTNDRMPQDNSKYPLPDSSLNVIFEWILHGAQDMYGNVNHLPNKEPVVGVYGAVSLDYQTVYSNIRHDSVAYNPFILPLSVSSFYIAVVVTDDSTPVSQLPYNRLKISTAADDFSSATVLPGSYLSGGGKEYWVFTVNPASFPQGDTIYMRYDVNDGSHPQNTEFPRDDSPIYYKLYWSFIRQ